MSLVCNGKFRTKNIDNIGNQPAILATIAVITSLHPDLIISAGTAGGLKDTVVGDIILSQQMNFYVNSMAIYPVGQLFCEDCVVEKG